MRNLQIQIQIGIAQLEFEPRAKSNAKANAKRRFACCCFLFFVFSHSFCALSHTLSEFVAFTQTHIHTSARTAVGFSASVCVCLYVRYVACFIL